MFVLESVYFTCCCSITNANISHVAHKLHQIHMNNQEKFTTRSSALKVHGTNLQTISLYSITFSTDILFSSLVTFCLRVFLYSDTQFDYAGG